MFVIITTTIINHYYSPGLGGDTPRQSCTTHLCNRPLTSQYMPIDDRMRSLTWPHRQATY